MWKMYSVLCTKDYDYFGKRWIIPIIALSKDHAQNIFESTYGCEGWLFISVC